ncbi:MAG: thioesterase family protein [Cyanobacteria bacterium P01_C01_bin.89]
MVFSYSYQVQFKDTDGAGVVYFSRFLDICHGAYEASLAAKGIILRDFFSGNWRPTYSCANSDPNKDFDRNRNAKLDPPLTIPRKDYVEDRITGGHPIAPNQTVLNQTDTKQTEATPINPTQEDKDRSGAIAIPIVETQGKFYRPCCCGDLLTVSLHGQLIDKDEFKVEYQWWLSDLINETVKGNTKGSIENKNRPIGTAMTRHVCVSVKDGRSQGRYQLPPVLHDWLEFVGA